MNSLDNYNQLKAKVSQVLLEGKERARQAVERERVRSYHEVGGLMHDYLSAHQEQKDYGENLVNRLAQDVGIGVRQLYDTLKFYRFYPKMPTSAFLVWSHYRTLLQLPEQALREVYQNEAIRAKWSVRELESQIRAQSFTPQIAERISDQTSKPGESNLPSLRGQLHTYRVLDSPNGRRVDLGFKIHATWPLEGLEDCQPGDTVISIQKQGSLPPDYRLEPIQDRRAAYYTYRANCIHIVDGDTLRLDIDCGFGIRSDQRIRFRGIDTPELPTAEGIRAKNFVEQALSESPTLVITTTKPDKYDRYLSDVFYLPGESDPETVIGEGRFLNRELIQNNLAVRA